MQLGDRAQLTGEAQGGGRGGRGEEKYLSLHISSEAAVTPRVTLDRGSGISQGQDPPTAGLCRHPAETAHATSPSQARHPHICCFPVSGSQTHQEPISEEGLEGKSACIPGVMAQGTAGLGFQWAPLPLLLLDPKLPPQEVLRPFPCGGAPLSPRQHFMTVDVLTSHPDASDA